MIAIINEHEYILNDYYTAPAGRLHLFINNTEPCDLNQLKEDVETGPVIITNEESKDAIGTFFNYTILQSFEIKTDPDLQIYITTDIENPDALITALQTQVNQIESSINKTESSLENTESSVQELNQRLTLYNNRLTDIEEALNSTLSYFTNLEQSLNSALERLDHAESLLNEIITKGEDPAPSEPDQAE